MDGAFFMGSETIPEADLDSIYSELRKLADGAALNTDDHTRLEFEAPKRLLTESLTEELGQYLAQFSSGPLPANLLADDVPLVKLAAAEKFDAVLCDLNLGGASSGQAAAADVVTASRGHKPLVIFMTGELASGMEGREEFEGSAFLQKPFRIADVLTLLRESLEAVPSAKK